MCSAIHPLCVASPFMKTIPWADLGVTWIDPPASIAHPLDDGTAGVVVRSIEETAEKLGDDGRAYTRLFEPLVRDAEALIETVLAPMRPTRHVLPLARFGLSAIRSVSGLARSRFDSDLARALFGGIGAHSMLALEQSPSGGVALLLGLLAHHVGWTFPAGGAQVVADGLVAHLESLGGKIEMERHVDSLDGLPRARAYLCDVTPRSLVKIAGDRLPERYKRRLGRFRYGPGVFKMDWALSGPVPWKATSCASAATVHLGGTLEEISAAEAAVTEGRIPEEPFVLFVQHSPFDETRAPKGKQTAWAYCHVPHGSDADMTHAIETQVERFAPGFRDLILERATRGPRELEMYNPNLVGGDINGGIQDLRGHFARPVLAANPYRTPGEGIYICSSSTAPGGGVHGMCGHLAARAAIRDLTKPPP